LNHTSDRGAARHLAQQPLVAEQVASSCQTAQPADARHCLR